MCFVIAFKHLFFQLVHIVLLLLLLYVIYGDTSDWVNFIFYFNSMAHEDNENASEPVALLTDVPIEDELAESFAVE